MDLQKIRRVIISGVVAEDTLSEQVVLKGGNALNLVHGLGGRASLDVDFSMEGDFDNVEDTEKKLSARLIDRFDSEGYVVFDLKLTVEPPRAPPDPAWGGYRVTFKLITKAKQVELKQRLNDMRRQSVAIGEGTHRRAFKVEISKNEYCKGKEKRTIEGYECYVYSLPMLGAEKLRAICQQMPEYPLVRRKKARARDFYDIHVIVTEGRVDFVVPENLDLIREMFKAKEVPLRLLTKVRDTRGFHAGEWSALSDTIEKEKRVRGFDFYFDFVLSEIERLHSLWEE